MPVVVGGAWTPAIGRLSGGSGTIADAASRRGGPSGRAVWTSACAPWPNGGFDVIHCSMN